MLCVFFWRIDNVYFIFVKCMDEFFSFNNILGLLNFIFYFNKKDGLEDEK